MKLGFLRMKSIRSSILVSFSALIITALLIFMIFSMNYTEEAVIQNSQDYSMQLVEQVNASLDTYIDNMGNIAYMMMENQDVLTFLHAADKTELRTTMGRLTEQFSTLLHSRPDIVNIGILGKEGRYLFNNGQDSLNYYIDYHELDWYQRAIEAVYDSTDAASAEEWASLSSSHVQNVISSVYPWVVTYSMPIFNKTTGETDGVFFADLNYSSIDSLGKNISLGTRGYVFIVDDDANIIYHPQQQLLHSGVKSELIEEVLRDPSGSFVIKEGENDRVYTFCRSNLTGWTVVGVSYLNELMKNRDDMQTMYYLIAMILFVAAILIASLLSREISKPVRQLQQAMQEVETGNFDYDAPIIEGTGEIADLGATFGVMTRQIQHLMEQNVQEQREKRKSELNALQSQINPHFLYNTLDSIIWMAEGGKNQEVVLMTSSLAKLLRQSISNEDEIVTIEKEIGYTRSYLTIQKMRYKDQLEFEIDMDEDTLRLPIVKLVVQPLVENAIYHGIKYADHKGLILIASKIEGDCVAISIEDNGRGMSPEVLAHILENRQIEGKNGKVGVYNVNNRLQLYYGPEYGLSYESEEGVGTRVTITIPLPSRRKEAEDEDFLV